MKINRKLAIKILKYLHLNSDFYFPFNIVCKEFSESFDDDDIPIEPHEWEIIENNDKYQTFELCENLQDLHEDTIHLMAKGFLEKINNSYEE